MTQTSLSQLFERTSKWAHVTIGVQQKNIVSPEMDEVVARLEEIAPRFNQPQLPRYWFYAPEPGSPYAHSLEDLEAHHYQLGSAAIYQIWPAKGDKVIPQSGTSIFRRAVLENITEPTLGKVVLAREGVQTLLIDGLFSDDPDMETVLDARKLEYEVILLEDLTSWPQSGIVTEKLKNAGVVFANSSDVIRAVEKVRPLTLSN